MRTQKSKSNILRLNSIPDSLKKQIAIQKQATKKYQKFKKSASQPAYFLNQSRLKKISQKLSKNYSLNRSKSLHNNITPQKKQTPLTNNGSFKRQSAVGVTTVNMMNKAFETTEKTKRLRLDKTLENQNSHMLETPTLTTTRFFATQVERLEEISKLNTEKAFMAQYEYFFKSLKQDCFTRKGCTSQIKSLISKFCYLMQQCQSKISRIKQRQQTSKFTKIQSEFSTVSAQLKKKSFKLQLLIKEIDQLKLHNMKIAKELFDLKEEKRMGCSEGKGEGRRKRLRINNVFEMRVVGEGEQEVSTPVYMRPMANDSNGSDIIDDESFTEQKKQHQSTTVIHKVQKVFSNYNPNPTPTIQQPQPPQPHVSTITMNQRLHMIKRIRQLEKKQRQLVKTLMVLKTDGVDVQRAFNEVVTGQVDSCHLDGSSLNLQHQRMPHYIKKINNNSSYDADSSIVDSIQGLTVRYFDGEPEQEYIFYPIKHEHKSKQLNQEMQNRLKLNFEVLYEDYQQPKQQVSESESEESEEEEEGGSEGNNPPTI